MPPEATLATPALPPAPAERRALLSDAAALLLRAAAPERRHLLHGTLFLALAAGLRRWGR